MVVLVPLLPAAVCERLVPEAAVPRGPSVGGGAAMVGFPEGSCPMVVRAADCAQDTLVPVEAAPAAGAGGRPHPPRAAVRPISSATAVIRMRIYTEDSSFTRDPFRRNGGLKGHFFKSISTWNSLSKLAWVTLTTS